MARLFWQRCPECGRLVLSRLGGTLNCPCRAADAAPAAIGPFASLPDPPTVVGPEAALPQPLRLALLTPEEDAIARRLLEQALPNGVDL